MSRFSCDFTANFRKEGAAATERLRKLLDPGDTMRRQSTPDVSRSDEQLGSPEAIPEDEYPVAIPRITGRPTCAEIIECVAKMYDVTKDEILCHSRHQYIMEPRQIAMWLSYRWTIFSLPVMGRCFGDRDHTTILHGVRKIEARRRASSTFKQELDSLDARVRGSAKEPHREVTHIPGRR